MTDPPNPEPTMVTSSIFVVVRIGCGDRRVRAHPDHGGSLFFLVIHRASSPSTPAKSEAPLELTGGERMYRSTALMMSPQSPWMRTALLAMAGSLVVSAIAHAA